MYIPAAFSESDLAKLHALIEQNSFGLLVSQHDGQPFASHLPFLLDRQAGPQGCLIGHVAKANPQWEQAGGQTVLAVFSGPHAYITPTWYEAEQVVPTWNYVAIHVYGQLQIINDRQGIEDTVQKIVRHYEQSMPKPWAFDGSTQFAERMLAQIVAFHIPIDRIEGKLKLSQNQPVERRIKVANALQQRHDENSQAIAAMMEEMLALPS